MIARVAHILFHLNLNNLENRKGNEMEWTKMLTTLSTYKNADGFTIYWGDGLILGGVFDTISETDNCLEEDDPNYKEYYMCIIEITDIIRQPDEGLYEGDVGDLIEISVFNEPIKIEVQGKGVVWQKNEIN